MLARPEQLPIVAPQAIERMPPGARQTFLKSLLYEVDNGKPTSFKAPGAEMVGKIPLDCVLLTRTSGNTDGILRQRDVRNALDNVLLRLIGIYEDPNTSGFLRARAGLLQCMAHAPRGYFQCVAVEAYDRVGRKMSLSHEFWELMEFYNIPVFSIFSGRVLTAQDVVFETWAAANERTKIARRTNDGNRRTMRDSQNIGKALAIGHDRVYERFGKTYTIEPNEYERDRIREAHDDFKIHHNVARLVHLFNARDYPPPGDAESWGLSHFINNSGFFPSGILCNEQAIGVFWYNRTEGRTAPRSEKTILCMRPETDWIKVDWEKLKRPELVLVDTDVFHSNRAAIMGESYVGMYTAHGKKKLAEQQREFLPEEQQLLPPSKPERDRQEARRTLAGGLLTSTIRCGSCGSNFQYATRDNRRVLICGGLAEYRCDDYVQIDAHLLEKVLVERVVYPQIVNDDVLELYAREYRKAFAAAEEAADESEEELKTKQKKLEKRFDELLVEVRFAEGKVKERLDSEKSEIKKLINTTEAALRKIGARPGATAAWESRIASAKAMLQRLLDREHSNSKDADDLDSGFQFREFLKATFYPREQDYAGVLEVTVCYDVFFREKPEATPSLTSRFDVHVPARRNTMRRPDAAVIKTEILENPDAYKLSDEQLNAVRALLAPRRNELKDKRLYQRKLLTVRSTWDGIAARLQAGLSPGSDRLKNPAAPSVIAQTVMRWQMWPKVLAAIEAHGGEWVGELSKPMLKYLCAPSVERNGKWEVVFKGIEAASTQAEES
jgi:DNA invertase Pin-like site-specific DNA recombinase